jgi:energy-coupling factor transport system permease protein
MFRSLYLNRGTAIHRLDPRTKIIGLGSLSVMLFTFNDPRYVAVVTVAIWCLAVRARSLKNYFRVRYLLVISFVIPFIVWQFYLQPPAADGHFWHLTLTRQSLLYGLAAGLRYSSVLMLGTLFASTIAVEEFMLGLIRMRTPYAIAFIFSLAVRLIPTFASVLATIVEAQIGRGLDMESRNPFKRARNLAPVILPFFVYTIRYSLLLSIALETRGFSLEASRTYLLELHIKVTDYAVIACLICVMTAALVLRFRGYGAVIPNLI